MLDKPEGITSNAALTRAKRVLGIRKAGHTGTLDPMATGLLPLCFGEATKVSAFLLDATKTYLAGVRLGVETDSGDREGRVIAEASVPPLTVVELETELDAFRGEIDQVPPMHSALKHQGRRLHELARQGIEVERKPRRVRIESLHLLRFESPELTLRLTCSKGTYVRSLAIDLGRALGCGAHLIALRRERSGPFSISDAVTLESLQGMDADTARALLLPPDHALGHLQSLELAGSWIDDIRHGRAVQGLDVAAGQVRIYGGGRFLGIGDVDAHGTLRVKRGFAA
ncbi:MAG: tRNA pseudouridine(55) synthase TruB [Wenzhouxiangellaceae bacterium]|nr:tRNA pseudouridine(55) synthase TruB [Wenzhouxiangellaceae bacterium]